MGSKRTTICHREFVPCENDEAIGNEEQPQKFKCDNCHRHRNVPLQKCWDWHRVCYSCVKFLGKDTYCPIKECQKVIFREKYVPVDSTVPIISHDARVKPIKANCGLRSAGCNAVLDSQFLRLIHQTNECKFRDQRCPLARFEMGKGCKWSGFGFRFADHILGSHSDDVAQYHGTPITFQVEESKLMSPNSECMTLTTFMGVPFLIIIKKMKCAQTDIFHALVRQIGETTKEYHWTMQVLKCGGGIYIDASSPVEEISHGETLGISSSEYCLKFDEASAKKFLIEGEVEKVLRICVAISEVEVKSIPNKPTKRVFAIQSQSSTSKKVRPS